VADLHAGEGGAAEAVGRETVPAEVAADVVEDVVVVGEAARRGPGEEKRELG